MRRTPLLNCLLFLLLASVAWARLARVGERVGVVLFVQGDVQHSDGGRSASIRKPLKVLDALGEGDMLYLGAKASLTLSLLDSGVRYDLKGPLQLLMTGREPLQRGPGVSELEKQSGREGILATQNVDLAKFGGTSSRDLAKVFVDDGEPPLLNLDLMLIPPEASAVKISIAEDRPDSPWVEHPAAAMERSKGHDRVLVSSLHPEVEKRYYVFVGDGLPDRARSFLVIRLSPEDLAGVRAVEEAALDLPSKIELFECYAKKNLYIKAQRLLTQMAREYPTAADWATLQDTLVEARRNNP